MTLFDFIVVLVLLVSGAIGFMRGAAREIVTVLAFIIAVVVAVVGLRISGPLARHAIHPNVIANAVAILVVFAAVYILLRALGLNLAQRIQHTEALGVFDRTIGVGFGLVRGLVLLGMFYVIFNAATPAERVPHWIKDAAFYPLSGAAGHMLMTLAPEGSVVANKVGPVLEQAVKDGGSDGLKPPPSSEGPGYDEQSRKSVDDLVEKTR